MEQRPNPSRTVELTIEQLAGEIQIYAALDGGRTTLFRIEKMMSYEWQAYYAQGETFICPTREDCIKAITLLCDRGYGSAVLDDEGQIDGFALSETRDDPPGGIAMDQPVNESSRETTKHPHSGGTLYLKLSQEERYDYTEKCFMCGEPFGLRYCAVEVYDAAEFLGYLCYDCIELDESAQADRLGEHAARLRQHASWLEDIAAEGFPRLRRADAQAYAEWWQELLNPPPATDDDLPF